MAKTAHVGAPAAALQLSVLLVDHHDDTRALYREYLNREGCLVEEAADGREALAKAITRHHDVIVATTRLPGIDGYHLCQLLRRDPSTMATPLIVMTADAMHSDVERVRLVGADAALVKPCLPEALWSEMRRVLERGHPEPAGETTAQAGDGDGRVAARHVEGKRPILSRLHRRGPTTTPPNPPPNLRCPDCDSGLTYHHSNIGGVSERHAEQWDYFECPSKCGTFEYRQRTRKIRRVADA